MVKNKKKILEEIDKAIGIQDINELMINANNHISLYRGITEQLLFGNGKYERMDMSFLVKISSMNYGNKYRVLIIGCNKSMDDKTVKNIEIIMRDKYDVILTTNWNQLIISILPENMVDITNIKELYYAIEKIISNIKISLSTIKYHLEDCHAGLQEALRTYDMIETMKKNEENLLCYEELGIYGLLYDLNETTVFDSYYKGVFQNIWSYDEKNETHLFDTLECYFRNECDKEKTANELFIHQNTLRYRLHQIEEVLDKDLKNINVITDIVTALKVRRMLQILEEV